MNAAQYNTRFLEPIPRRLNAKDSSLLVPDASDRQGLLSSFPSQSLPQGLASSASAPELGINDTSLLNALDESIFSITTASVSTIPTPIDVDEDPFTVPIKAMLDEAHPVPVIYSNDGDGIDAALEKVMDIKKNKHSILRVVKKAGASAKKFAHKTKSLTMRREHKMAIHVKDLFDVPAVPHNTPALGPSIAVFEPEEHSSPPKLVLFGPTESVESLAATLGSPTTLSAFPIFPPVKFALRPPPASPASLVQRPKLPASNRAFGCRLLLKAVLFFPYALAVGFLPLLAPAHLSHIAFSPIFGYASQPETPFDRYNHHMRLLPCHIGLACGFLGVLGWNLLHSAPLVFAALVAVLVTTAWWMWRDFDAESSGSSMLDEQDLGVDDMVTIYHLYESTVPYEMRHALHNMAARLPFRRQVTGVPLVWQERGPERVRIIVQYDD